MRILLLLIIASISLVAQAQNYFYLNKNKNNKNAIELIHDSGNAISLKVKLNAYSLKELNVNNKTAYTVSTNDGTSMLQPTCPDLAKLAQSLIIPNMDEMILTAEGVKFIDIENINIAPSKGNLNRNVNPDKVPFVYGEAYQKNEFFPGQLADLSSPYIMRNFRGQTVNIYPFQYNPVSRVLRIYTEIKITVQSSGNKGINVKAHKNVKVSTAFTDAYKNNFINYKSSRYDPVSEQGNMLILTPDSYYEQIKQFAAWKNQKGIKTEIVNLDEIGYSNLLIKNFVANYYSQNELTFLLLVGDAEDLPPLTKSGDSDAAYGHIEGNDSYPEVIVGRFSVTNNEELQTMINKTIYYERDLNTENEWLTNGIGIASAEGSGIGDNGESDIQHMNLIRNKLLEYCYTAVDQIYDPGAYALQVIDALNNGRSVMNYVGHGSDYAMVTSNFNVSSISELENYYKYPYVFDVACVNGNFNGRTCFAEAFMRAKTDSSETGAVAIIASTINQDWAPPMNAQDEMVNILTESYSDNINRTFGGITINGCMHMIDNYGASGSRMTDTWTIFGDPTLNVRTKNPEPIVTEYAQEFAIGMNEYMVTCDQDDLQVTFSLNDTIIDTKQVSNGQVTLDLSTIGSTITKGVLTIVGYNKVSVFDSIEIIKSNAPFIIVSDIAVNDSDENNNQLIDYGETLQLDVQLHNIGIQNSSDLLVSISDTTGFIEYHDNCTDQEFGALVANEKRTSNGVFTITVSENIEDQTIIPFKVNISSTDESWERFYNIKVNAPQLQVEPFSFSVLEGEILERIDPGDVVEFSIPIVNIGNGDAKKVELDATVVSPYITIEKSETLLSELNAGDTAWYNFVANVNPSTPNGEQGEIFIDALAGTEFSNQQWLTIGLEPVLNIGDGDEDVRKYPFYNYYHSNKTQILYNVDDLGMGEKTLESISFILSRIPNNDSHLELNNLQISLWHSTESDLLGDFASASNAEVVFYSTQYTMPDEIGEVQFDIEPFRYNGTDNLILQLSWGQNDYFEGTYYFKTLGSNTAHTSVAYGYKDNSANPSYIGSSKDRPNTKFVFSTSETNIQNVNFNVLSSENSDAYAYTSLQIGGLLLITNEQGEASTTLNQGKYVVYAMAENSESTNKRFVVNEDNQEVVIDMSITSATETNANSVLLYPNPTSNKFTIQAPENNARISIYNNNGIQVYYDELALNTTSISTEEFAPGVYFVKIQGKAFSKALKLIIE